MKKLITILLILVIAISAAMAQAPQQFKYQAVLRDTDGAIMANESVTVAIDILQGSTSGSSVFSESHEVITTAQGIINLNIGSQADLSAVDWSADDYFIQITVNGTVMGTSQLLSVPYAQYANEAGNTFSGSYNDLSDVPSNMDTDYTDDFSGDYNDLQNLPTLFSGNYSDLTNTPTLPSDIADLTDNSNLLFDGNYNSLSNLPVGDAPGEIRYWDGSRWQAIAPGANGEILMFNNGTPTWANYEPGLATVIFDSVYEITGYNAHCDAKVTSEGGNAVTERGILWGENSDLTINDGNKITNGVSSGVFSTEINGLDQLSTYHVRAYAINSAGTTYSDELSFTTNSMGFPTVVTSNVDYTEGPTAVAESEVTDNGGFAVISRGICWSTNENPSINDNTTTDGNGLGVYSSTLTGLLPNETYYVRAYATNEKGTSYGEAISFNTLNGLPTIISSIKEVGTTTASINSEATANNGYNIVSKGACWSTSSNPTLSNTNTNDGSGSGSFVSNLTSLTEGETYYVRGYTATTYDTVYSGELVVTAGDLLLFDIDGNDYEIVQIGTQKWMAENLKTTKYNNSEPIVLATQDWHWSYTRSAYYCWYENDSLQYADTYGALYNWYAVNTGNLCPDGWHVPTDEEWKTLEMELGMSQAEADNTQWRGTNEGSKLGGNSELWTDGDLENDSEFSTSGFFALPGGWRHEDGYFMYEGYNGWWWSSNEIGGGSLIGRNRTLDYGYSTINRSGADKKVGTSIRCLKD